MKSKFVLIVVFCIIMSSCKTKTEQIAISDSALIAITKAQFELKDMAFGEPMLYLFTESVYFTGTIIPGIDGQAQISLPIPGIISKIYFKPGQVINKGSVLFEVSGNEFIDMQKDFAESFAVLARLKSDFNRSKELYDDNIVTHKDFVLAESNYYAENARFNALKIKLENMGLDVSIIEKGNFYPAYFLKSPINGFVATVDATIGQFVEPQHKIAEIINNQLYHLKLNVFEKDIYKVKAGQSVLFYLNGNKSEKFTARINSVGKTIMNDTRSIDCYAAIENYNANLVSNQFVEGDILTAPDSAMAVPETAVINSENDSYLLILENEADTVYYFKKTKVSTGRKSNDYIELTEQLPSKKLLISGINAVQIE